MTKPDAPLWYLAHPVAPDEKMSLYRNIADGQEWWAFLVRAGFLVTAPWIGLCLTLDDTDDEDRAIGMAIDLEVLERCDGLIHTGHRVSKGMAQEAAVMNKYQRPVVNLTAYMRNLEAKTMIDLAEVRWRDRK